MIGTVLGHYRVESKLGEGGMGEVYRARDTRLNRTVAIKVLPVRISQDPDFRARFAREARTISTLDHPNICTLYDVGEVDGTSFLVMQHLEGETLAARLMRGPLPLDQALRYASEIAAALHHAHRHGIVHRDLKPGNVMLTGAGARLLDFGLAKRMPGAGAFAPGDSTVTVAGTIVGTIQYMAPEQIEGREIDARTDLFAFGAVLHEMLTGRRAFTAPSQAGVMGAILRDSPAPPSSITPAVPPALDHVVQRCLAKDPDERWASAHDVLLQLSWMRANGAAALEAATPHVRRRQRAAWMAAPLLLMVAAAMGWFSRGDGTRPPEPVRFTLPPPTHVSWNYWGTPGVSPDGRYVAIGATSSYTGDSPRTDPLVFSIFIRPIDGVEFRSVEGVTASNDGMTAWSADSRWIVFPEGPQLKRADASGGSLEVISRMPPGEEFAGATVNGEGTVLVGFSAGPLRRVPLSGGSLQPVWPLDSARGELAQLHPFFLPDGRRVLFVSQRKDTSAIVTATLGAPDRTEIVADASHPLYVAPGLLLFRHQNRWVAQRFDISRLTLEGTAAPIEGQRQPETMAVSSTGTLVYRAQLGGPTRRHGEVVDANTRLAWFDRQGRERETLGPPGAYVNVELSPDGRWAAVEKFDNATEGEIWIYDTRRGLGSRLTSHPLRDSDPAWSPRGDRLAWTRSNFDGNGELWVQPADGSEPAGTVPTSGNPSRPGGPFLQDWSPDGRYLAVVWLAGSGATAVEIVPIDGSEPVAWPASEFSEGGVRFSPDGRWVAYISDETGSPEVYVQTFPPSGRKVRVSSLGGMQPAWRRDGKELFYLTPYRTLMSVPVRQTPTGPEFGEPAPLFKAPVPMPSWGRSHYRPSADGTRFLLTVLDRNRPAPSPDVVVVLDWARAMYDELRR